MQPLAEMNLGEGVLATKAKGKGDNKKRLSVERIYQRKTQLEHVLLRPDTYIGSVEETTENMWVFDEEKEAIVRRPTTYVPGLYKIFDEILGMSDPSTVFVIAGQTNYWDSPKANQKGESLKYDHIKELDPFQ